MSVLGWILFGFVIGAIARAVMPGRDPMGFIGTTVLGIIGALAGGWIGQALGLYRSGEGAGFIAATLGALIVLGVYNMIARKRRGSVGHHGQGHGTLGATPLTRNRGVDRDRDRDRDRDPDRRDVA